MITGVHKNSAPSWVTRNFGEPSDSFDGSQKSQSKYPKRNTSTSLQ